jgi:hypothetical protein
MDLKQALGGPDNLLLIGIAGLAMVYVATGPNAWAEEKWGRGASAAAGAAGLVKSGKLIGKKEGWEEGYGTFNPKLHLDEIVRYQGPARSIANTVAHGVADAAVSRGVDLALSKLPQWPAPEPPPLQLQQPAAAAVKPAGPPLPKGWRVDGRGRFRDQSGRVASDERRMKALDRERQ